MQTLPDSINAGFEGFATVISWLNIKKIKEDKKVFGVSAWPTTVFTLWGLWNVFYYPYLGQYISMFAAFGMVVSNTYWLYLVRKYYANSVVH